MSGIQVSRSCTAVTPHAVDRAAARAHFDEHRWVRLPAILAPDTLAEVQHRLGSAEFVKTEHHAVSPPSVDLAMVPNEAAGLLELLFNDPALWRVLEAITGCERIARFGGFVYRLEPGVGLHHNWHDDVADDRLLAMSVNLGRHPYDGGQLRLRDEASGRILASVTNVVPGDALVFRIAPGLRHRVEPVTSGVKTAFAGWFCGGEGYAARLRHRSLERPTGPAA